MVIIAIMTAGMVFGSGAGSEVQGYLTMIIVLSLIFVGIKRYRDKDLGGVIKFLPALGLGAGQLCGAVHPQDTHLSGTPRP